MAIDGCKYTFMQLTSSVLPGYMIELRRQMAQPIRMSEFATKGVGIATLLRKFNMSEDFKGCYVFMKKEHPIYVGISQTVLKRIFQHVRGTTHYSASLAYRITATKYPHKVTRNEAMTDAKFINQFNDEQKKLKSLNVAYIEILNPLELYLFEPYCAMELDTNKWNTFETH